MISALAWVPKGASRRMPEKLKLSEGEMRMVQQMAADEAADEHDAMEAEAAMEEEEESDEEAAAASADDSGLPASFKMDEYDEEDDDAAITNYIGQEQGEPLEEEDSSDAEQDASSAEDADMDGAEAMNDGPIDEDEEEEDDELENDREDVEILPTDAVILVANTEEEFSNLEVQVYDDDNGSLYVHHEINLPAFPLSLAWMDCAPVPLDPTKGPVDGSFVAIGTFKPGIEIWDLNVLDVLEPSATLGGEVNEELREVALPKQSRRRKNKQVSLKAGSHQDSVMSLDWNSSHRNMLASGSADSTVKVWDITTQACLYTMSHHSNKVQSVRWNPAETTVLASASFDRTIVVLDGRQPDAFSKFALSAEVESITWAPHNPSTIVAATEDGMVAGYDVRMNGSAALFSFQAHAGAVSAVSFSAQIPGLFATAGVDKTVKIWDLKDNAPVCITSKDMNVVCIALYVCSAGVISFLTCYFYSRANSSPCRSTRILHTCWLSAAPRVCWRCGTRLRTRAWSAALARARREPRPRPRPTSRRPSDLRFSSAKSSLCRKSRSVSSSRARRRARAERSKRLKNVHNGKCIYLFIDTMS